MPPSPFSLEQWLALVDRCDRAWRRDPDSTDAGFHLRRARGHDRAAAFAANLPRIAGGALRGHPAAVGLVSALYSVEQRKPSSLPMSS